MDGDGNSQRWGVSRKAESGEQKKVQKEMKDSKGKERKKRRRIKWLGADQV